MGRSGPKKFTDSQHKGHAGIGLIHMLISEMGHEWHDRVVDVGIDGSIELRDPSTSVSRILCKSVDLFTFSGGFYRWGLMRSG